MIVRDALDPARPETLDVVCAVLDVPRSWPARHASRELSADERVAIDAALTRYRAGMPVAYAARRAAFRHLTLQVDERVLIPRPETELIVDLVLGRVTSGTVIDVGTGSGAIALSLATEGAFAQVIATDVSADALAVARTNVAGCLDRSRAGRFCVVQADFLTGFGDRTASVIVSNPPYIAEAERLELPSSVTDWEPDIALFAGPDGLDAVRALAGGATRVLVPGGWLVLEVDARRAGSAAECVSRTGGFAAVSVLPDLTGRARFVAARLEENAG